MHDPIFHYPRLVGHGESGRVSVSPDSGQIIVGAEQGTTNSAQLLQLARDGAGQGAKTVEQAIEWLIKERDDMTTEMEWWRAEARLCGSKNAYPDPPDNGPRQAEERTIMRYQIVIREDNTYTVEDTQHFGTFTVLVTDKVDPDKAKKIVEKAVEILDAGGSSRQVNKQIADWFPIDTFPPLPTKADGSPEPFGDYQEVTNGGPVGSAVIGFAKMRLNDGKQELIFESYSSSDYPQFWRSLSVPNAAA